MTQLCLPAPSSDRIYMQLNGIYAVEFNYFNIKNTVYVWVKEVKKHYYTVSYRCIGGGNSGYGRYYPTGCYYWNTGLSSSRHHLNISNAKIVAISLEECLKLDPALESVIRNWDNPYV